MSCRAELTWVAAVGGQLMGDSVEGEACPGRDVGWLSGSLRATEPGLGLCPLLPPVRGSEETRQGTYVCVLMVANLAPGDHRVDGSTTGTGPEGSRMCASVDTRKPAQGRADACTRSHVGM